MKRTQVGLISIFVLAMLVVPCQAFAFFGADIGVGYWQQTPSGTLSYKALTVLDAVDLKDDLHFDKQNKPFVRARIELPLILPNIYVMATPMSFDGSGPITRTIHYGDQAFSASAQFETKLKLDHYDLALFYPIPLLKTATLGKLNIDLGLNARKIDFEGTITGPNLANVTTSASKSLSLYMPMIFAGIQVKPIDVLSLEFEIRGIAYSGNHYYDYLGRLKYNPIPLVFIAGGYRAETIKIDQSDVKADIKFGGPFVEVGLSF